MICNVFNIEKKQYLPDCCCSNPNTSFNYFIIVILEQVCKCTKTYFIIWFFSVTVIFIVYENKIIHSFINYFMNILSQFTENPLWLKSCVYRQYTYNFCKEKHMCTCLRNMTKGEHFFFRLETSINNFDMMIKDVICLS